MRQNKRQKKNEYKCWARGTSKRCPKLGDSAGTKKDNFENNQRVKKQKKKKKKKKKKKQNNTKTKTKKKKKKKKEPSAKPSAMKKIKIVESGASQAFFRK